MQIESLEELPPSLQHEVIAEIDRAQDEALVKATIEQAEAAKALGEQQAIDELGRQRLNIHPTIYHYFGDKYGYECWQDEQFINDFEKAFPESRVKCGGTKLQVGYTGSSKPKYKKVYANN